MADRGAALGLDADEPSRGVGEAGECSRRVRPTTDARGDEIRVRTAQDFTALRPGFVADDALELANHDGVRMGADHGADAVVRGFDIGHPVP